MRMKKLMILAAVAAIAATACTRTFEVEPTPGTAIGFGTWANTLTKAEHRTPGTNTFLSGDTFNIYGFKTISSTPSVVFNGDVVTAYDASDGITGETVSYWKYDTPLRFWDPSATSYTFFAASPSGKLATAPAETGEFETNELTFGGHDNDILIADKKVVAKAAYSASPVTLNFNHMASRIDIKVKKDISLVNASATVTISAASLAAIKNTGTLTITGYDGGNHPTFDGFGWTPDATPTTTGYAHNTTLPLDVSAYTEYTAHVAGGTTSTPQDLFTNFVLMPQDLSDHSQKIVLSYTITTGGPLPTPVYTSTYTDVEIPFDAFITTDRDDNTGTAITGWLPGKHYTYYITIGANAITFSAEVTPWTVIPGYNYLVK